MDNQLDIRKQFPITRRMTYLDAARMVPAPLCVIDAVTSFYNDLHEKGEERRQLEEKSQKTLEKFAGLINAAADEIVFIKNTTEGLNIAANGLPLKPGDNVIVTDLEHLNNVYPWLNLQERRGVEIRILKNREGRLTVKDLGALVDRRTRGLAVSFVTLTGLKIDLKSFGQFCRTHDMYLVVDGIQGVGRVKLDVKDAFIDIMSCGGHKALMAGRGIGCLFIDRRILDSIAVTFAGPPLEVRHDAVGIKMRHSAGANKFHAGGSNYLGISALHAGLEFLEKVGIKNIEAHILHLGQLLIDGLKEITGVKILSPHNLEESAGIVSFTTPDNPMVTRALEENKIRVSIRGSGIRISPHFYNTAEEITKTIAAVQEALAARSH